MKLSKLLRKRRTRPHQGKRSAWRNIETLENRLFMSASVPNLGLANPVDDGQVVSVDVELPDIDLPGTPDIPDLDPGPGADCVGLDGIPGFETGFGGVLVPGEHNPNEDYHQNKVCDFGDAPNGPLGFGFHTVQAENGAFHVIVEGAPMMGHQIDAEPDGQPTIGAHGDDLNGAVNDEDGVVIDPLIAGMATEVTVTNAGATGLLNAWVDLNGNRIWDGAEHVFINEPIAGGGATTTLSFNVPNAAVIGETYMRFRINSTGNLTPDGGAPDGEVQDYVVKIEPSPNEEGRDFGDAPNMGTHYPVTLAEDGARHIITHGPRLGRYIDAEADGQPSIFADKDDMTVVPDDEDGVLFLNHFVTGGVVNIEVSNSGTDGLLNAWFDWDGNVTWDPSDQIFINEPIPGGGAVTPLSFTVPTTATTGRTYGRFRIDSGGGLQPYGLAKDGEVEDYIQGIEPGHNEPKFDFGDAPNEQWGMGYPTMLFEDGARHLIVAGAPQLGDHIDPEVDGQPDFLALGDDNAGIPDDEDGVQFVTALNPGGTATVEVTNTGATGLLNAWIDFNADGTWDPSEQIFTDEIAPGGGAVSALSFPVPASAAIDRTYARFRLDSHGGLATRGPAEDGEVEDYLVSIEPGNEKLDYGDAPNRRTHFPVTLAENGARHRVTDGPRLGKYIDSEPDGQPSLFATRDDATFSPDDEDGVRFLTPWIPGSTAYVAVSNYGTDGLLNAWIDFDANRRWDPSDQIFTDEPIAGSGSATILSFAVPNYAKKGRGYARFRINSSGGLQPYGYAGDGEVEDYVNRRKGDVNLDGIANNLDITSFINVLAGNSDSSAADIDESGEVNNLDITGFVERLASDFVRDDLDLEDASVIVDDNHFLGTLGGDGVFSQNSAKTSNSASDLLDLGNTESDSTSDVITEWLK